MVAAASPASSAETLNATAIFAAISVKAGSLSKAMPNWPPCSAIAAISAGIMPICTANSFIRPPKAAISPSVPSATFFTPAIALSKAMASLANSVSPAALPTTPPISCAISASDA